MTAKIIHAFRLLNGKETKINSILKMIDGRLVLVWPLASPFYSNNKTLFGIPINTSVTCADSILAKLPPFILISPKAMLELADSERLRADIQNGTIFSNEPSLHPASPDMFFGGTSLVQDSMVVLSPAGKTSSENTQATVGYAFPRLLSIEDFVVQENHSGIVDGKSILATINDAKNDKADPFLFHGDALIAKALQRDVRTTNPFSQEGTVRMVGKNSMEQQQIFLLSVNVTPDCLLGACFDTKQTGAPSVFAIPYTPVVSLGDGQSTPSVTGRFYPELIPAQSEGRDTPTLYSSMVRCGFDLHDPEFFNSTNFGAAVSEVKYGLVNPLAQYSKTTVGTKTNIRYSLRGKMSLQTEYLPSTASQTLLLDQHPVQTQYMVDTFGAYGVSDIQNRKILRFTNRSTVVGIGVLFPDLIGVSKEKEGTPYGGYSVTELELRDSLSVPNKSLISSFTGARPVIRLPIEVSCGAALVGTNRMDHTPNVLEVVDLDSAHITTVDLLPIEEIDLLPVMADDEENYFKYQF